MKVLSHGKSPGPRLAALHPASGISLKSPSLVNKRKVIGGILLKRPKPGYTPPTSFVNHGYGRCLESDSNRA